MKNLFLVRHGQSIWNQQKKFTGWVDIDLNDNGRSEAEKAGNLIKMKQIKIDLFYTSYQLRAKNTLKLIQEILGEFQNTKFAWQLNERHYGALTGLNKAEMKKKLGEEQFKKYRRSWDIPPPKLDINSKYSSHNSPLYKGIKNIPNTESLKDTYERVVPYFQMNIEKHLKQNKNVLLSAHGNTIRALGKKIFNISDRSINLLEIPTGNPLIIDFDKSVKFLNAKYLDESRKTKIISNQ